jgi:hypothetical protein
VSSLRLYSIKKRGHRLFGPHSLAEPGIRFNTRLQELKNMTSVSDGQSWIFDHFRPECHYNSLVSVAYRQTNLLHVSMSGAEVKVSTFSDR